LKNYINFVFTILQKVGKSLMVPVSVLPAAGLLVAFGRILQDLGMTDQVVTNEIVVLVGNLFYSGGLAIFEQLPVVFAIGVAIGFTGGAGVAGLASVVGYYTLENILKVLGEYRELTLQINTGVFGGIIMGLIAAALYNKFYQTQLPKIFGFFAGKRLVPILTAVAAVATGLVMGVIWPPVQGAINEFGTSIMSSELGPAFYAAGKRLLIPVGLHHVYYPPFLYEFGEYINEAGKVLNGESVRYFAGDPKAGKFMAAEFPIMLFGLPAAAFAMYLRAPKSKRVAVGGVMLSAALTSIMTGITEPIEFAFIFVAPLLYVFHVVAAFASGFLTNFFDIHLGYTFSASLIDFGVGYFNQKNSSMLWLVVGPVIGFLYFSTFYILIPMFKFKTPGREDEDELSVLTVVSSNKALDVLIAIGNKKNIKDLDACITRLRLTVHEPAKVDQTKLKSLGAAGIMNTGNNFQIIFGTESEHLKEQILAIDESAPNIAQAKIKNEKTSMVQSKDKTTILKSPLVGEIINLVDVPDPTFSGKLLGDGIAIKPTEGTLYAPVDGEIVQIFHTNHALGIKTVNGSEILIHIGIDTVKMKGEGFTAFIKTGDFVKEGDKLIEFDLDLINKDAKSDITPMVITNMETIGNIKIETNKKHVTPNDSLLKLTLN
jgi:glucose-specific phosphotransferase system IIA component